MKKISVIIPCYNSQTTLNRCIDSVLRQTYKNFELIIVDDGSTDNTEQLIKEYCKKDNRIVYLSKANGGTGSSRNLGLKHVTGDYIQFVDSDDDVKDDMFEKMLDVAQKTYADMVVCRFSHCCFKQFLKPGEYNLKNENDFIKFYMDFFTYNVPWNKLFKREVITSRYNENLKIFEDGLFVLENLKNIGKTIVLEDELYNYYNEGENKKSLVNTFLQGAFWENKVGYWYEFDKIKPMFDKLLKANGHHYRSLEYARSFDMAFWELIKIIDSKCSKDTCVSDMNCILNEKNFIDSVCIGGYDYEGLSLYEVKMFIEKCFREYEEKNYDNTGSLYFKIVEYFYEIAAQHKKYLSQKNNIIFDETAISLT